MTKTKKPVNSHGLALEHGNVYASVLLDGRRVRRFVRGGKSAHWAL